MKIRVRVSNYKQFGRLARRLREAADGGLQRDLNAELARTGPPVLTVVRSTVRGASFPVVPGDGGSGSTGFRAGLAAATLVRPVANGIQFYVNGAAVGRGLRGHRLAMLSDTELAPRWRHPVYGNREAWVTQQGQPWFFEPIRGQESRFRAAVGRGIDKTISRL